MIVPELRGKETWTCAICGAVNMDAVQTTCRPRRSKVTTVFGLRQCSACHVSSLAPPPTQAELAMHYTSGYASHRAAAAPVSGIRGLLRKMCLLPYRGRFGRPDGVVPPFGGGQLLDIGCGIGDYLSSMARLGWSCSGCDSSAAAIEQARRRVPDARLFAAALDECPLEPASFDLITLWHTLEHLPSPLSILRRIHGLLVPGGRLVVAVPNVNSFEARLFGRHWLEIDIPGHLFFFDKRSLTGVLDEAGFESVMLRPQVHPSTATDAFDLWLDDVVGVSETHQRLWLYYILFPLVVLSYVVGNWGCIEAVARKAARA